MNKEKRFVEIGLVLIGLLLSITVSAGAKRRVRIPRELYPYDLIGFTRGRSLVMVHHYRRYSTRMSANYVKTVVRSESADINQARRSEGARPLIYNRNLARLARWRARQATRSFSHYNRSGQTMAWRDAQKMRIGKGARWPRRNLGENLCRMGKLSQIREPHYRAFYYFMDPRALAGSNVFDLVNNDAADHYAHALNIMSYQNRYVGIGADYDARRQTLFILSEFSRRRPVVYKSVKRRILHRRA